MFKKFTFIIFTILIFLFSCKKEEKIVLKEEKKTISGTWYSSSIRFRDVLNGIPNADNQFTDSYPYKVKTDNDLLPSQIKFNGDGSYTSVTHRELLYFAIAGNVKGNNNGGTWYITTENKIYFDKGFYEFNSFAPRILQIVKSTSDSLILETSDPNAVYDWTYIYSTGFTASQDLSGFSNSCNSNSSIQLGGLQFAQKYAAYKGYLDATKNVSKEFNPFGLGLRRGGVDQFNKSYTTFKALAPLADSCYKSNFDQYYDAGYQQAQTQLANYKNRTQRITFYFSRIPNP